MSGDGVPVQVFVDLDGTITFSDLPPDVEEVARLLDLAGSDADSKAGTMQEVG